MLNHWIKGLKKEEFSLTQGMGIDNYLDEHHPDLLDKYKVGIISSNEHRPRAIRESLGTFQNHFKNLPIIDFGYFRKEDPSFNIQLINELMTSKILLMVIDKDFRWFSEMVKGASMKSRTMNMCISNKLHFSEYGIPCDYIGFQRHLVELDHLNRIGDHSINSMSLGKLRAEVEEVEPIMRDVDFLYFDIAGIRSSDVPGSQNSMPSGLTCEESCQLMKYAGRSNQLKMIVLGGDFKADDVTCNCLGEMLWYFLEGKSQIKQDHPSINQDFNEYIVEGEDFEESFTFVKNKSTGRWWLSVDGEKNEFISCSYNEYHQTISNELPDRLLKHLAKI